MSSVQSGRQLERQFESPELDKAIRRLWESSRASLYGLSYAQLREILLEIVASHQRSLPEDAAQTVEECKAFLFSLKLDDLILARACAAGNEKAWEAFLSTYRELLYTAACAIARHDTLGRELADSLYAELYGTSAVDGVRKSKLNYYLGRGSLAGWLRSVLAQRFVDDCRRSRRIVSLEEHETELGAAFQSAEGVEVPDGIPVKKIGEGIVRLLQSMKAEESFLLQAYYLDQRTMAEIAQVLGKHESTISRRLSQLAKELKERLLRLLQAEGYSRRAAEEALGTDVRDLDVDVRKFLQAAADASFQKIGAAVAEEKH